MENKLSNSDINNFIEDYTSFKKPWSFGGIEIVHHYLKNKYSLNQIKNLLESVDTYTKFVKKKPKTFIPFYRFRPRQLLQADIVYMQHKSLIPHNDGYKYILVIIDTFTRYLWTFPLKTLKCAEVLKAFKLFFKNNANIQIENIQVDKGSEFKCNEFKNFLLDKNVNIYSTHTDRKAAIAERVNLSLQQLIYKKLTSQISFRWIDYLNQAVNIYNNRKHKFLKITPKEAENKENFNFVLQKHIDYYGKNLSKIKKIKKINLKINDFVRLNKLQNKFVRGYKEYNTTEIFKIYKIDNKLPRTRYFLKDMLNEPIIGTFFSEELVKVKYPFYFIIEDVLDEKIEHEKKFYLIKWLGYSEKFNTWIPEKNLKNINLLNDNEKIKLIENLPNVIYVLDKNKNNYVLKLENENFQIFNEKDFKNILFTNIIKK